MAPSLLKTVGAAAAALATQVTATATTSYKVAEVYNSTNFFDKFDFVTGTDPNGGYVQYQSRSDAKSLGLIEYKDNEAYVGVDYTKTDYNPEGVGRKSVRLESKNVYNHGLIIADFTYLPKPVCGSWPAFWFFGEPWPTKGEIDVYENWNDLNFNRHTAHVDAPSVVGECKIVSDGMTSTIDAPNCYDFADGQAQYQGCSASKKTDTFGSSTGGVYALEWTSEALKIWEWSHLLTPLDVTAGKPTPNTLWGTPSFVIKKCDIEKAFKDMKMVLNIDFCGVAGQDDKWKSCKASTGYDTCAKYVAKKASDFSSVNFKVKDIKVYQLGKDTQTSTTSSAISASTISSATLSTGSVSMTSNSIISSTSSYAFTNSSSVVSSTVTSSVSSATSSTVSDDDEDYCTDDDEETSSSYVVSPTAGVPVTTTSSSGSAYVTSPPATSSSPSNSVSEYPEMTTSTIYATTVYTITSCAATVTNCPAGGSYVTTETISVGVTVCTVSTTGVSSSVPTTTAAVPESYTTSTVEVTKTYTITSCAATVTNCPVGSVTTEVSVTTTVYPIENASSATSTGTDKPVESTAVVVIVTPSESTSVVSKPQTESTATTLESTAYIATTNTVATSEAISSSVSTTTARSESNGSGSNSVTDVYVTATVVPVTSVHTGFNSNTGYPNATLSLTKSITPSAAIATSSGGAAATTTGGVVEVGAGVKTSASLALAGVAAMFLIVM